MSDVRTLAAELTQPTGWRAHAACTDYPTDWWFPERGQTPHQALAVCQTCPVAQDCLDYRLSTATTRHYDDGVWGGTVPRERAEMRMQRMDPIANPRRRSCQEAA